MTQTDRVDCTIIGGGPAGLYAAFYAGMRDLTVRIIENKSSLGGKLHFYPEKTIWDIGGQTPISGMKAMEQMISQAKTFEPEIILDQKITEVNKLGDNRFEALSSTGKAYYSKALIIATGGGIFNPKRLPNVDCTPYEHTNVHYTIKRTKDFKNKRVAIVGGGNSAIDWANELEGNVSDLYVIHRSDSFRAHESQLRKLRESKATIYGHTVISELIPDISGQRIHALKLRHSKTDKETVVPIDDVIINIGFETEDNFHQDKKMALPLVDNYYIKGTSQAQTAVDGLYAIGDILDYSGKVRLISGAFNDGINAVNQVRDHCYPKEEDKIVMSSLHEGLQQREV